MSKNNSFLSDIGTAYIIYKLRWLIIIGIILFAGIFFVRNSHKLTVPNFKGLNYTDEILTNTEYTDNFKFETESVYSTDEKPGIVLNQNPEAETKVKKGKIIKLQIAYNDDSILVTGILGLTANEAETRLKQSGFEVKVITSYDKNSTPGVVFDSYPSEGSYAEKGSLVTIYVSTDENPNAKNVPNVVGYNKDIATQLLKAEGFTVTATTQDSDKPEGEVIDQTPKAGEEADSGSSVTIIVSTGVPSESTATITVNLPTTVGSSTGVMKVYLESDLYQKFDEVLLAGGTKTVEIKGKGTKSFNVLVNDQTIMKGTIDFTKSPAVVSNIEKADYVEKLAIPNVVGKSVSEAKTILENAGFKNVDVFDAENNPVSSGTVVTQTPVSDSTTYTLNQKITLNVE